MKALTELLFESMPRWMAADGKELMTNELRLELEDLQSFTYHDKDISADLIGTVNDKLTATSEANVAFVSKVVE